MFHRADAACRRAVRTPSLFVAIDARTDGSWKAREELSATWAILPSRWSLRSQLKLTLRLPPGRRRWSGSPLRRRSSSSPPARRSPPRRPPSAFLYVVRTGGVELLEDGTVVDLLEEGELFGHPSLVGDFPAVRRARVRGHALLPDRLERRRRDPDPSGDRVPRARSRSGGADRPRWPERWSGSRVRRSCSPPDHREPRPAPRPRP